MTAAEVALSAPVVRPGNDLGNSMSIRPGMVAGGRGRSEGRMAVKAKMAVSWLFLTVTRREKAEGSRIRVAPSPPRGTSLAKGAPEGGGEGEWRAVDRATRYCTDMHYRGSQCSIWYDVGMIYGTEGTVILLQPDGRSVVANWCGPAHNYVVQKWKSLNVRKSARAMTHHHAKICS